MAKKTSNQSNQKELIIVMVLSLALGLGGGYAIGNASTDTNTASKISAPSMQGDRSMFDVPADQAPTIQLEVVKDTKSGYNVQLATTNFTFAPENVNQENVIGEGHGHLYVGDELIARLYGPDFHYRGNFEGTKTFRVTLNGNDHSEYAVDGRIVEASVDVINDGSDANQDTMKPINQMDSMNKPE